MENYDQLNQYASAEFLETLFTQIRAVMKLSIRENETIDVHYLMKIFNAIYPGKRFWVSQLLYKEIDLLILSKKIESMGLDIFKVIKKGKTEDDEESIQPEPVSPIVLQSRKVRQISVDKDKKVDKIQDTVVTERILRPTFKITDRHHDVKDIFNFLMKGIDNNHDWNDTALLEKVMALDWCRSISMAEGYVSDIMSFALYEHILMKTDEKYKYLKVSLKELKLP